MKKVRAMLKSTGGHTLIKHIRNERKEPEGTLVSIKTEEGVRFGWSKYHKAKETEPFTKKRGVEIATGRALSGGTGAQVPDIVKKEMKNFVKRARKYFKMEE